MKRNNMFRVPREDIRDGRCPDAAAVDTIRPHRRVYDGPDQ